MTKFLFGVHLHQPVGNFDSVMGRACSDAYEPLLLALGSHRVPFTLHVSGPLLEWMEDHRPGILDTIRGLVATGRVELLGGPWYEPILAAVPEREAEAQIRGYAERLRTLFGVKVRGIWLTERVWEPSLAALLADAGVEYTFLDDHHFLGAGVPASALDAPFVTEGGGRTLKLFSISEALRYTIPFREPEATLEVLRARGGLQVMVDDGEKFGLWPGTREWVHEEGWLERFLRAIETAPDVECILPRDAPPASRRVYVPAGSYMEMGEWALPAESALRMGRLAAELRKSGRYEEMRPLLRGAFWRTFLDKYPESDWMQKRVFDLAERLPGDAQSPDSPRRSLWRATCNCAYWHGVFGGLYLPHLRGAVWHHLARAESSLAGELPGGGPTVRTADVDRDGRGEVQLLRHDLSLVFVPHARGALREWLRFAPPVMNCTDSLTRRFEAYHVPVEGASGERASIHDLHATLPTDDLRYDWYRRESCLDHLLEPGATPEKLRDAIPCSRIPDSYAFETETEEDGVRLRLVHPEVTREVFLPREGPVRVSAEATSAATLGSEWNLSIWPGSLVRTDRGSFGPEETGSLPGVRWLAYFAARFEFADPVDVWYFPLQTVSKSEKGFDRTVQATTLLFTGRGARLLYGFECPS